MVDFVTNKSPQYALGIGYDEKYIKGSVNTKFPDIQIDNRLDWKNRTEQNIPTLYGSPYAVRSFFHFSNTALSKHFFFVYFDSVMKYGIIWGEFIFQLKKLLNKRKLL
jgi:hypothetical protein